MHLHPNERKVGNLGPLIALWKLRLNCEGASPFSGTARTRHHPPEVGYECGHGPDKKYFEFKCLREEDADALPPQAAPGIGRIRD